MTTFRGISRDIGIRVVAVAAAAMALTGCLLSPGTFTADMTVQRSGGFSFAYKGEIYLLGLSQLAEMGASLDKGEAEFTPGPCYGEPAEIDAAVLKASFVQEEDAWAAEAVERECTATEIEEQRTQWDDQRAAKQAEDARNIELVKALMGGIDPSSPEAIDEFITRIQKQKGWRSVVHKGNGLFEVDYAISGRIDQDFTFPVIEKTQGLTPFVVAVARANGAVRIDAPAFASAGKSTFMGGSMGGLLPIFQALGAAGGSKEAKMFAALPKLDGTFILRTDGDILTNNTDDGPAMEGAMRTLTWKISPRRDQPPEALIMLDAR